MPQPSPQRLEYAQHHEKRPPMYVMVFSILAATFLMFMGTLFFAGAVAVLPEVLRRSTNPQSKATILLFVLFPLSCVFLLAGIAQLGGTIRQLRGITARATAMERAFRILNTDLSGRTFEDRYR